MGKEKKNMMKQMNIMKTEMSSKLYVIIDLLTNLQGYRTVQGKDQLRPKEVEQEVAVDDEFDAMEIYN